MADAQGQEQHKKGFFGGHHDAPQPEMSMPAVDMASISRRLRTAEESLTNLRKIVQVTEENMLVKNRHFSAEVKTLTSDINELRHEMHELKEKIMLIIKEMQELARKDDVKVLERYINMWNPVQFVTHGEVEDVVRRVLRGKDGEDKELGESSGDPRRL